MNIVVLCVAGRKQSAETDYRCIISRINVWGMKMFSMIWFHCAPGVIKRYILTIEGEDRAMQIKDTPYFNLYADIWRLHGKYIEPTASDSFWNALTQDADTIYKKYKESPLEAFAERLLLDVCKEIEQTYRRNINN